MRRGCPSDRNAFNASWLNALPAVGPPLHYARSKAPFSRAHLQLAGCRPLTCLYLRSLGSVFPTSRPDHGFHVNHCTHSFQRLRWLEAVRAAAHSASVPQDNWNGGVSVSQLLPPTPQSRSCGWAAHAAQAMAMTVTDNPSVCS